MLNWFKRKASDFFTPAEKSLIESAITNAEKKTSGEIRVFIENKCQFVNPLDRAVEKFEQLNMHKTHQRNAVLVYIAMQHRQLAVYADVGIYQTVGKDFWNQQVKTMLLHFNKNDYAEGIATVVNEIGIALQTHFPYNPTDDVNELPNDIVFGG